MQLKFAAAFGGGFLTVLAYRLNFSTSTLNSVYLAPICVAVAFAVMFSDTLMGSVDMATASLKSTTMSMFGSSVASDYPEDQREAVEKMERLKVGGLYNEGNTCFMNSVIQSFAALDHLTESLRDHQNSKHGVSRALLDLVQKLDQKYPSRHVYSTDELIKSLEEESRQRWSGYDQEDAQEFFQQMLSAIEKDWETPKPSVKSMIIDDNEGHSNNKEEKSDSSSDSQEKKGPKLITPFDGVCYTRVGCLRCSEMEGLRSGVVSSIDLSLQSMSGGLSLFQNPKPIELEQLIGDYCHMEIISGVECYRCSLVQMQDEVIKKRDEAGDDKIKAIFQQRIDQLHEALKAKVIDEKHYKQLRPSNVKVLADKSKQTMFGLPMAPILMVHINRSVFDIHTGYSRKNHRPVKFPLKLDMSQFVVDHNNEEGYKNVRASMLPIDDDNEERESLIYTLKAAIVHIGSHNFGHYECYRRCSQGYWWRVSDDSVILTKESTVLNAQGAFMLFYERGDFSGPEPEVASMPEVTKVESNPQTSPSVAAPAAVTPTPSSQGPQQAEHDAGQASLTSQEDSIGHSGAEVDITDM